MRKVESGRQKAEAESEMALYKRAIVRAPGKNFAEGLTTVYLGRPDYWRAMEQHEAYCAALERCGLMLLRLEPDDAHPDSTFVEDTAVLTGRCGVLTRPGAPSRRSEVAPVQQALANFFPELHSITDPATVDGGDICEAGDHFFIGISERTNEAGAEQLARVLTLCGYTSTFVDIRGVKDILHLKSGIASLSNDRLVVIKALCDRAELSGTGVPPVGASQAGSLNMPPLDIGRMPMPLVRVPEGEEYAANCVQVNDFVLVAAGFPQTDRMLRTLGYETIALEMSEFQKMDGGLSCLSLRF